MNCDVGWKVIWNNNKTIYANDSERTLTKNKYRVQEALEKIKLLKVDFSTRKFELVNATIGNYFGL